MKYLAAYCLCVLGGNEAPSAADIKKVLKEVEAPVDDAELNKVIESLKGKQLHDVISAGMKKVGSLSFGAGGASSGPVATESAKVVAPVKEEPTKKESSASFEGGLDMFAD